MIPPGLHLGVQAEALVDDDALDRGALLERVVHVLLEQDLAAAAQAAVGGDHHLRLQVLDARLQRLGGEAAEDHGVRDAQARAGQHGHRRLRDHGHIDDGAAALLQSQVLERVA